MDEVLVCWLQEGTTATLARRSDAAGGGYILDVQAACADELVPCQLTISAPVDGEACRASLVVPDVADKGMETIELSTEYMQASVLFEWLQAFDHSIETADLFRRMARRRAAMATCDEPGAPQQIQLSPRALSVHAIVIACAGVGAGAATANLLGFSLPLDPLLVLVASGVLTVAAAVTLQRLGRG